MSAASAQYTDEEIVNLGKELYERTVKPVIPAGNDGRVVAVDIQSGEFELADDALTSAQNLRARLPEAVIYVARVGYPGLHTIRSPLRRATA